MLRTSETLVAVLSSVGALLGRKACCLAGAALLAVFMAQAAYGEECSIAKTNHDCTLTIDRGNPLAPPTIQMYPRAKLQVVVMNPYPFERYFMDYSSGQVALSPDVASSIVTGLLPSLKNLSEFFELTTKLNLDLGQPAPEACTLERIQATKVPVKPDDITPALDTFYSACLNSFSNDARNIYVSLEPAVAPDAHPQGPAVPIPDQASLNKIADKIDAFYYKEVALSAAIAAVAKLDIITPLPNPPAAGAPPPPPPPVPPGTPALNPAQAKIVRKWVAAIALADPVAKDLYAFEYRIHDLRDNPTQGLVSCDTLRDVT